MATIALYANKINCMPGFLTDIKKFVLDYSSKLFNLQNKTLQINESMCSLAFVINTIQASSQTQEEKTEDAIDCIMGSVDTDDLFEK